MVLQLDDETEALVRQIVERGRYRNAVEVVREAVRQLEERDRRWAALRVALAVAEGQIERGEAVEWTPRLGADIWEAAKRDAKSGKAPKADVLPSAPRHPDGRSP